MEEVYAVKNLLKKRKFHKRIAKVVNVLQEEISRIREENIPKLERIRMLLENQTTSLCSHAVMPDTVVLKRQIINQDTIPTTARKMSKYEVFSGPYFPLFRLNTEIYRVKLRIQSKYGKIQARKNSALDTFHAVNITNRNK